MSDWQDVGNWSDVGGDWKDVGASPPANMSEDSTEYDRILAKSRGDLWSNDDTEQRRMMRRDSDRAEKNRFLGNVKSGFQGTLTGAALDSALLNRVGQLHRKLDPSRIMHDKSAVDNAQAELKALEPQITEYRQRRSRDYAEYMAIPNWYDDPDIARKLGKGMESLAGQLVGGLPSPENFLPFGRGKTVLGTFLRNFFSNAPAGAASNLINQLIDVELGIRKDVDLKDVAVGGVTAGTIGGVAAGAGHAKLPLETKNLGPSGEMLSPKEASFAKTGEQLREGRVDPNPLPKVDPTEPAPTDPLILPTEESRPRFEVAPDDQLPDIKQWVDVGSLETPADKEAFKKARWSVKNRAGNYPKLKKEFQVPEETPAKPTSGDFPKIENGFGLDDVEFHPLEDAPYMPGRLAEQANVDELPGSHEMQFLPNDGEHGPLGITGEPKTPYADPKEIAAANQQGLQGTGEMHLIEADHTAPASDFTAKESVGLDKGGNGTSLRTNPIAARAIMAAKTLGDALRVVHEFGSEPEKLLAKLILSRGSEHEDILYRAKPEWTKNFGEATTSSSGVRKVVTNPLRGDASTILHEAVHMQTNDAFYAADVGRATPEQLKYIADVKRVQEAYLRDLERRGMEPDKVLLDPSEFNSYALTEGVLQNSLSKIKYRKGNLLQRMLSAVKEFFGAPENTHTAFDELLDLTKDWNKIKDKDVEIRKKNVSEFIKASRAQEFKDLGGNPKEPDAFAKKVAAMHGQFKSPRDLAQYLLDGGLDKMKDIQLHGDFVMNNQMAQILKDNPVIAFVFNYLSDAHYASEARMVGYDKITKPVLKWAEKNWDQAGKFLQEWTRMNASPEERQTRLDIEKGGVEVAKEHFGLSGVTPETVEKMWPLTEVMKDIHKADIESLGKINREIKYEPFYFPLGRNGPYHFVLTDETGKVAYASGFSSLREAKKAQQLLGALPDGWNMSGIERTDPTRQLNPAIAKALLNGAPPWLANIAAKQFGRRMEYLRNFELNRNGNFEIGGYLGQNEGNLSKETALQLITAFSRRARESQHLQDSTAAMEIARSFLDSQIELPKNTNAWVHTMIARHIGLDPSRLQVIDKALQGVATEIGKSATKVDSILHGYDVQDKDNVLGPEAARQSIRAFSWFVSLAKIGLVPNVLLGNALQNVTIGADGVRMAARLGVSTSHAMKAQIEQLGYMATLGYDPKYKDAKAFMEKARREGLIDPHGREDYTTTQNPADRSFSMEKANQIVQLPRNIIERGTNWNAILYYKLFFDSAFPDMDEALKTRAIYNAAKSFTGDYTGPANLFGFEKAGDLGHLTSNFARWKFNRTSRLLDDLSMAVNVKEYGARALIPIVASLTTGALFAGIQGSAGLVEYEAIRRWGTKTGLWDWKPLSAIIGESAITKKIDDLFGPNGRTFVERGAITAFGDSLAQKHLAEPTGPDISGSIRESSFLEAPTVALGYMGDTATAAPVAAKKLSLATDFPDFVKTLEPGMVKDVLSSITEKHGYGITSDEKKAVVKVFPSVIQEAMKEKIGATVKTKGAKGEDIFITTEDKKDQGNFIRDEFQQKLAKYGGGIKTTEENNFAEGKQYHKWLERQSEKELTGLKDGILNNLDNGKLVSANAEKILVNHGQAALEKVLQEVETVATVRHQTGYFGLESLAASKKRDDVAAARAAERIKAALDVARPRTSSSR